MSENFTPAIQISELPPGDNKAVEIGGKLVLICHAGGQFYAISNFCSHAEEKLECGRMGKNWIACPAHGARFELSSGRAMNPPATQPIATYQVRVVGDWVEVAVD